MLEILARSIRTPECIIVNEIIIQKKGWDPEIANVMMVVHNSITVLIMVFTLINRHTRCQFKLNSKKIAPRRNLFKKIASYNKNIHYEKSN